jgi:hypothetical protein
VPVSCTRAVAAVLLAAIAALASAKETSSATLSAEQIAAKNESARGGVEAWRKIQTMLWRGHMESTAAPEHIMPFVLDQERPNKTRFDLSTQNQHSVRVYDGLNGWRSRPQPNGRIDVQPFSPQDLKFAHEAQTIDGPLIDHKAKGNDVALLGEDTFEGRKAYRLNVRLASGEHEVIWIDAQSFLDLRLDRMSFNSAGVPGIVSIVYRDFRDVEGLKIPMVMDIGVGSGKTPDKMIIEKVELNPALDARIFRKPATMRTILDPAQSAQAAPATQEPARP